MRIASLVAAALVAACSSAAPATAQEAAAPAPQSAPSYEIVLVHDIGSNAAVWDEITPFLQRTFAVWSFELAGHGKTPPVEHPSIETEVARLSAYIAAEGVTYPTLVGHGVGGMIALRYALDHPAQIHRLILIDTAPKQLATRDQQIDMAAKLAGNYEETVALRYLNMSPLEDVTERVVDDALRTDSASFVSLLMSTNEFDVTSELPGLSVPMLVIGSELMFPSGIDSREVLGHVGFVNARALAFKRIEGAGHFVMLERPVYTASVLLAFGVTAEYEFEH
jgi:pimeloyl-ACP methyl ester carboxylesterase